QAVPEDRRAEVVAAFLAGGRTVAQVADEHNLTEPTLREWIRQASDEVAAGGTAGPGAHSRPQSWAQRGADSAQYQAEAVALFRTGGKTMAEIAHRLNLSESTVREWLWHAPDVAPGRSPVRDWAGEARSDFDGIPFEAEVVEPGIEREGAAAVFAEESAVAETATQAESASVEAAELVARAEAKAARAANAKARAEAKAASAVGRAESVATEAEVAARAEIAAAYVAAVEAMLRAEVTADERVAQAEAAVAQAKAEADAAVAQANARADAAVAQAKAEAGAEVAQVKVEADAARAMAQAKAEAEAEVAKAKADAAVAQAEAGARAEAEAAARAEIAAAYAAAVEAVVRSEVTAGEAVARTEAAAAEALALGLAHAARPDALERPFMVIATQPDAAPPDAAVQSEMVPAGAAVRVAVPSAEGPAVVQAEVAARVETEASAPTEAEAEAAARAEIALMVARLVPVEVWVQMVGRTVAEARDAVLEQLGVDEAEAEIEVVSKGSRLLPGRARVRARLRLADACRT
ncbi:MAG: Transposase, partial [Actinomycetota bacterium]|nr:Transposase [Actinomycetota bacterium]